MQNLLIGLNQLEINENIFLFYNPNIHIVLSFLQVVHQLLKRRTITKVKKKTANNETIQGSQSK